MQLFKLPPPPNDLECTPEAHALAARDSRLAGAANIRAIITAEDNRECAALGSDLQKLVKTVEATRKELVAPYFAAQKIINASAAAFCDPITTELTRLGRLASVYRAEEERKAEAERRARAEEISRLQEQARLASEAGRMAAEKGDAMAELRADINRQALSDLTAAAIAAPEPEATKTAGQSFRPRQVDFRCVDPIALWNARPDLCNGPTPKASAIKAVCTPERPVPGLELFYVDKVNFNSR